MRLILKSEACQKVKDAYYNEEIILEIEPGTYFDTEIEVIGKHKDKSKDYYGR